MQKEHLPIYGVGPFYGVGIIAATVLGIVLSATGVIKSGKVANIGLIAGFSVLQESQQMYSVVSEKVKCRMV